jgi:uncharacterized protein YqhQ
MKCLWKFPITVVLCLIALVIIVFVGVTVLLLIPVFLSGCADPRNVLDSIADTMEDFFDWWRHV